MHPKYLSAPGGKAVVAVALLCLPFAACLPIAAESDTNASAATGGGLSIDDVYQATMALVATAQLHGLARGEAIKSQEAAEAVASRIRDRLSTLGCAKVGGQAGSITVDFGQGCALPPGKLPLQGKATVAVSTDPVGGKSALTLDVTLDSFGSGGKTATGACTIVTQASADGTRSTLTSAMTAGDAAMVGGVQVDAMGSGDVISKTVLSTLADTTVTSGTTALSVDASAITFAAGACYPSAGSIVITSAGLKATLSFDADTAATGVAQFTPPLSTKAQAKELPGLGWKCL